MKFDIKEVTGQSSSYIRWIQDAASVRARILAQNPDYPRYDSTSGING
jgi:hypothetical protein